MPTFAAGRATSRAPRRAAILVGLAFGLGACGGDASRAGGTAAGVVAVEEVGLNAPYGAVHDPLGDVYLVSNAGGGPADRDENGFVSRISPDGEVLDLAFIPPFAPGAALHAPKGMAIQGDSLLIADLDCIAIYERATGNGISRRCLEGVTSLVGLDVGPGVVYVTDSGLDERGGGSQSTGTAAVYRLVLGDDRRGATLAGGPELGHPRGIAIGTRGIFVATSDPGQILRLTAEGQRTVVLSQPGNRFEGVVFVADGGFAYASSTAGAVYLVDGQGRVHPVIEGISTPGNLGYDPTRNRLLLPLPTENRLLLIDLP